MPISSYQKLSKSCLTTRQTARIQEARVSPFISYSSCVLTEHTHYGSTSSHPSCHLHCVFCSVNVWQAVRWTTTAEKEPLNEQTRNGKHTVWISLGRAPQRLKDRLMRQLEGIHIYWSFKLKGAAILLFYTPFRIHLRKQLSSGFSVNRPYSSPISLCNKSPLGPLIVLILMNITTVFCNCTSPFCCVKFFLLK